MKYNFLIVDEMSLNQLEQLNYELKNAFFDYEIVYATSEPNFNLKDITICRFDKKYSQDEILNRLIPKQECDGLIIIRKYNNAKEIINTAKSLKKPNQIVINKKNKGKISTFFSNLLNSLLLLIFHYKLYDANLSTMAFGNNAIVIMKHLSSPSILTKINRWTGIEIVEVFGGTNVNFHSNLLAPILAIVVSTLAVCGIILMWVFLPKLFSRFFIKLLAVFAIFMAIFFAFIYSLKLYIIINIGKNEDNRANLI